MFYPLLCGNYDKINHSSISPVCSPRKSKRKKHTKNNPYSTRGLDQFSSLLAELEEKRRKIYSRVGSQSIVRFVYKNSTNDCVPVVVNLKDMKQKKTKQEKTQDRHVHVVVNEIRTPSESDKNMDSKTKTMKKNVGFKNMRKPCCYVPVVIILILLFLMFFGRPVTILCTCIGLYMVPSIDGDRGSDLRTSMKKKDYVRRSSGNKLVIEKSTLHHKK